MALFRRKDNAQQEAEIDDNAENYDQNESEEVTEATEIEEEKQLNEAEETENIQAEPVCPVTFTKAKRIPAVSAPAATCQPPAPASKGKLTGNRVYLTTKVDLEVHSRLKMYCIKEQKTIVRVLEDLIIRYIPEV